MSIQPQPSVPIVPPPVPFPLENVTMCSVADLEKPEVSHVLRSFKFTVSKNHNEIKASFPDPFDGTSVSTVLHKNRVRWRAMRLTKNMRAASAKESKVRSLHTQIINHADQLAELSERTKRIKLAKDQDEQKFTELSASLRLLLKDTTVLKMQTLVDNQFAANQDEIKKSIEAEKLKVKTLEREFQKKRTEVELKSRKHKLDSRSC